jgi:hypothetical protein
LFVVPLDPTFQRSSQAEGKRAPGSSGPVHAGSGRGLPVLLPTAAVLGRTSWSSHADPIGALATSTAFCTARTSCCTARNCRHFALQRSCRLESLRCRCWCSRMRLAFSKIRIHVVCCREREVLDFLKQKWTTLHPAKYLKMMTPDVRRCDTRVSRNVENWFPRIAKSRARGSNLASCLYQGCPRASSCFQTHSVVKFSLAASRAPLRAHRAQRETAAHARMHVLHSYCSVVFPPRTTTSPNPSPGPRNLL